MRFSITTILLLAVGISALPQELFTEASADRLEKRVRTKFIYIISQQSLNIKGAATQVGRPRAAISAEEVIRAVTALLVGVDANVNEAYSIVEIHGGAWSSQEMCNRFLGV
ncbi:hypothetical protein HYALB_00001214 [Hymenoscyphus albidus]|uniref:Uncharacterized protein n=1 Tax=Hymenoscyphus albidus TaxID=595503 RepID=A0A9N9LGY6_9HELO|nr:hypothetical protein HYALB_00001214 [Hymenoscyphus albidus]